VSLCAVELLMNRAGIQGLPGPGRPRARPQTETAEGLVDRCFARSEPNQLWVTDITEHPTREAKVYCCVVLDVSRKVVGWSIDSSQTASLVTNALSIALQNRKPTDATIIYSDHGVQGGNQLIVATPSMMEVAVGRPAGWMTALRGRSAMKSPGARRTGVRLSVSFGVRSARGCLLKEAAAVVGVSPAVGARWFRHGGGMPPMVDLAALSGRYLSFREREEIAILRARDVSVRGIARALGRAPSTISRELRRDAATRGGKMDYRASVAQWKADLIARRPKPAKLAESERLRDYVQQRLSGQVCRLDGTPVDGPITAPWNGRGKPHRKDWRWVTAWSPEQIAHRPRLEFPDDESMRISHEAIYQALYVQSRSALKRELVACLRTRRALRVPRAAPSVRHGARHTRGDDQ
jgi:hypothetical protein